MTAIEDARAALAKLGDVLTEAEHEIFRELIAEHERLTAPPTEEMVTAAYEAFVAGPEYARDSIRAALEAAREAS